MHYVGKGRRGNQFLNVLCISALVLFAFGFLWRVIFRAELLMPLDLHSQMEPWRSELPSKTDEPPWNRMTSDALWQFYPMASYSQEAWGSGPPLWDPFILSGMPALARGELFTNPVFVLLASFLPIDTALNLNALATLLMGSLFMFLLLKEMQIGHLGAMVGSIAFAYNSYLIGWLSFPVTTASMVWLPLVLWSYFRSVRTKQWRWNAIGIMAFSLQILSGHVLWSFYTAFTFCLLVIIVIVDDLRSGVGDRPLKQSLIAAGMILGGTAIVTAPHILQTLELFSLTGRSRPIGASASLPIKNLIRFVAPNFWGSPLHGNVYFGKFNYTETTLYFGVLTVALIVMSVFSKRKFFSRAVFGFGLITLLAVYGISPFRQVISVLCPVLEKTFPGRIFFVTAFVWSISAAFGAEWLENQASSRVIRRFAVTAGGLAIALFLFSLLLPLVHPVPSDLNTELRIKMLNVAHQRNTSLLVASAWSAVSGMIFWLWRRRKNRPVLQACIVGVVAADLFLMGFDYNPSFARELAYPTTPTIEFLQDLQETEPEPFRILNVKSNRMLPGFSSEFFRLQTASGYSSWLLKRYSDYADLSGCRSQSLHLQVYFKDCCSPLLNALNVKYVVTDGETVLRGTGTLDLLGLVRQANIKVPNAQAVQRRNWTIGNSPRPVLFQAAPSSIEFQNLEFGPSTRLRTAISLGPKSWNKKGDGVQFQIRLKDSERVELLFSKYIDPKNIPEDRKWFPVEIDLSRFEDRKTTLSFATDPGPAGDSSYDWAGWAEPQLLNAITPTLSVVLEGKNKIYENSQALPRAWLVHRITEVPVGDTETIKNFLQRPDFDPRNEAVIEGNLSSELDDRSSGSSLETVHVTTYESQRVSIRSKSNSNSFLILSDTYYPGWKVLVDGEEHRIFPTNLIMRGVFLEAGEHVVEFEFRPVAFFLGLRISVMLLGILSILLLILRAKKVKALPSWNHAGRRDA